MPKITICVMSLMMFMFSAGSTFADSTNQIACCFQIDDMVTDYLNHNHMLEGIELTRQQRQQMRDLIQMKRRDLFYTNLDDIQVINQLVTAEVFDEAAVRAQVQKMALESVNRQIAIAKIRHHMYALFTPEQKQQCYEHQQQLLMNWKRQIKGE